MLGVVLGLLGMLSRWLGIKLISARDLDSMQAAVTVITERHTRNYLCA
jgi:hypothetical protein